MNFIIYHLTLLWTLSIIFAKNIQDCSLNHDSSFSDADLTCKNITLNKDSASNFKGYSTEDVKVLTLSYVQGDFRKEIFENFMSLKSLLIYRSHMNVFQLESPFLQTLQVHYSIFPNNSNFDNCCKHLRKLLLRNNTGISFHNSVFRNFKRLQQLQLSRQPMKRLTRDVFSGLTSLKQLRISDMNLKKIESDAFVDLKKLKEFHLEDNEIQDIDSNVFKPLKNLRELTIQGDNLRPLSLDMFSEQKKLNVLGLPLKTWREINIERIPIMFPSLSAYTHTGEWKKEDEYYFVPLFRKLNYILTNKYKY